ncbi:MAG: methylated-DNA--[protein]-cysteine S-methyltransferase [Anaerovoracaceae bacterium]|jgi:methylated-DNA-[protein]-cysteine S-methyltransferase
MSFYYSYDTALGTIIITESRGFITGLFLPGQLLSEGEGFKEYDLRETPLIRETHRQLTEYLAGNRKVFDVPLNPEGTEFQKRVWSELLKIPYGTSCSYGEIAGRLGIPKGPRAVGLANNRNPIAIIVPCHRVIGADKGLVGYGGGLHLKKALLDLEGIGYKE